MIGIMFWNTCIGGKAGDDSQRLSRIEDAIVEIVVEYDCDIVVLAEFDADISRLCNKLSLKGKDFNERKAIDRNARVKIIAGKYMESEIIRDSKYYVIHEFNSTGYHFLLGGVHFPSKLYTSEAGIQSVGNDFITMIKEAEKEVHHEKVVMIGDFNATPFESVMVDFNHIHAIHDADIVQQRRNRILFENKHQIFYNPMWNLLGDVNRPKGSYYSDAGDSYKLFWHIFDQIIMSADLLKAYRGDSLKIISDSSSKHFLTSTGRPDKDNYSDHLPIYFSFKEDLL